MFTAITQYRFNQKWSIAGRVEYANDQSLSFYSSDSPNNPFKVGGYSTNIDWSPTKMLKFRVEGRLFTSSEKMFRDDINQNPNVSDNIAFMNNNTNILFSVQVKID